MGQWFDKFASRVRNKVLLSFAVVVNSSDIHPTVDEEVLCIANCSSPKSDILFRSALDTKARKRDCAASDLFNRSGTIASLL